MSKSRQAGARTRCAIVSEDGAGHWVASGLGRAARPADSARTAILQALYGKRPVGAVVLIPPKGRG